MDASYLITGGTGGLGRAVAALLAERGVVPVIGHRRHRESEAREFARNIAGGTVLLELAERGSIAAAVGQLETCVPPLRGAVLTASPPPILAPFGQIRADDLEDALRISVLGAQQLLAGLVRSCFRAEKTGTVVGVLSAAMGRDEGLAVAGFGAYVITKFGFDGVLRLLAADYPWLVVETISPGFIDTPMLEAFDPRFLEPLRAQEKILDPRTVAGAIVDVLLKQAD